MYQDIASNKRHTWLLLGLFTGLLAAAGYAYGYVTQDPISGLVLALLVSVGLTLVSYFAGDKIVLLTSGAHELSTRTENTYIWNLVENLCITAGLQRPRIYIIDDPAPNAFATGRDPAHASIALTTGLINLLENEELEGVIAHELSHVKNLDTRYMVLVAVMVGALSLLGDFLIRGSLFGRRSRDRDEGTNIFAILGLIFLIISPIIGQIIKFAISREREYLADASGSLLTRYPEGLARALEKISTHSAPMAQASQATAHLWISNPFGNNLSGFGNKLAGLFSTHPPLSERIKRLRGMSN